MSPASLSSELIRAGERQNWRTSPRSVAAAASRWAPVYVLVPGRQPHEADGAFDLHGMGELGALGWPEWLSKDCVVVVDELTPEIAALLSKIGPRAVSYLSTKKEHDVDTTWRQLPLVRQSESGRPFVNAFIPVNFLAKQVRHHGFGFTGYQLVLSRRVGFHDDPPDAVAWLTASFHDTHVIVVEEALASAWKARA